MGDIWVISDTHWQHQNILNFTDSNTGKPIRPGFSDITHMNEYMVEKWNSVVKPGDKVYHLGDVVMGKAPEDWMAKNWPRLHGKKTLIVGNHDDIKMHAKGGWWSNIHMWRVLPDFGLLLTHVPVHKSNIKTYNKYIFSNSKYTFLRENMILRYISNILLPKNYFLNVHGHIHQNPSPKGPYKNVSVEAIAYTPVNIENLRIR